MRKFLKSFLLMLGETLMVFIIISSVAFMARKLADPEYIIEIDNQRLLLYAFGIGLVAAGLGLWIRQK